MKVESGHLTVQVRSVALRKVLEAVAEEAGLTLTLHEPLEDEVTAAFAGVPLDDGLQRLLGNRSYLLFFAPAEPGQRAGRGVLTVWGAGKPGPPATVVQPPGSPPSPGAVPRALEAAVAEATTDQAPSDAGLLVDLIESSDDEDVRAAALQILVGLDAPSSESLLSIAREDGSREIRMHALTVLAMKAGHDPRIRAALRAAAKDADPGVADHASSLLKALEHPVR